MTISSTRSFGYSCNGSPQGCEAERFGGCQWHYDRQTPARRASIIDQAREAQREFKAACETNGMVLPIHAWKMFHSIDALVQLYEEVIDDLL